MALMLTTEKRTEREQRMRSWTIRSEDVRRAHVILMLADGVSYSAMEQALPCYRVTSIDGVGGSWRNASTVFSRDTIRNRRAC